MRASVPGGSGRLATANARRCWIALLEMLAIGPLGCTSAPLIERPWIEITTRHFEIVTPLDEDDAVALASDLEVFRSFLEFSTSTRPTRAAVPTRIFAFGDRSALEPFAQNDQTQGYFLATQRANYLVMIDNPELGWRAPLSGRRACPNAVIFHEYVHHVLHNASDLVYPRWYDEGYAELLSCTEIGDEFVTFAHVPEVRRIDISVLRTFLEMHPDGGGEFLLPGATIRWLGVSKLLRETLETAALEEQPTFYAQSWALVHLLYFGIPQDDEPIPKRLTRYLRAVSSGVAPENAIQSAFGFSEAALDRALRRYVATGKFVYGGIARSKLTASGVESVRRLSVEEVADLLGELSLAIGKAQNAQQIYAKARESAPSDLTLERGLANALTALKRWKEAEQLHRRVLSVSPDDARSHLDFANFLAAMAVDSWDADAKAHMIAMAIQEYQTALRLDATLPEAHARYGWSLLASESNVALAVEPLEIAHRMLPSDLTIQLLLADSYAKLGRSGEALELLGRVAAWSHSEEQRAAALVQIQVILQISRSQ